MTTSKTETLFETEATLRWRAKQFADPNLHLQGINKDTARKNLRAAALDYAKVANEIDECFAEDVTP
jgi:hypothetical protein